MARCTVERLMGELGLAGAVRGKVKRTTISDPPRARPADLVNRRLPPARPGPAVGRRLHLRLDLVGLVYVAFVIDAYARRILGWRPPRRCTSQRPRRPRAGRLDPRPATATKTYRGW